MFISPGHYDKLLKLEGSIRGPNHVVHVLENENGPEFDYDITGECWRTAIVIDRKVKQTVNDAMEDGRVILDREEIGIKILARIDDGVRREERLIRRIRLQRGLVSNAEARFVLHDLRRLGVLKRVEEKKNVYFWYRSEG